jgi:hypothetical protein
MADVFRGKTSGLSLKLLPGYLLHGGTAILTVWLLLKALGR